MTALADIRAAIAAAGPGPEGFERVVLVGSAAERAIFAEVLALRDQDERVIDGVPMITTLEFDGWALRQCDPAGTWHEVK